MKLIMQHIGEAYAYYREPECTIQIYGTISDELAPAVAGASVPGERRVRADTGVSVSVHRASRVV